MLTLAPRLISNILKGPSRPSRGNQHLMLTGIHQTIFLNQWGEPETQIGLKRLGSLNKLGSFFLTEDSAGKVHHSVWIYKKRDRNQRPSSLIPHSVVHITQSSHPYFRSVILTPLR